LNYAEIFDLLNYRRYQWQGFFINGGRRLYWLFRETWLQKQGKWNPNIPFCKYQIWRKTHDFEKRFV